MVASRASPKHLNILRATTRYQEMAVMLRIVRAVQFVLDKLTALLRGKGSDEMRANEFLGQASCITRSAVDQDATQSSSDHAIAATNDQSDS